LLEGNYSDSYTKKSLNNSHDKFSSQKKNNLYDQESMYESEEKINLN